MQPPPRLDTTLRHALHTAVIILLAVGVLRAWQQASGLPDGHGRAVVATVLGVAFAAAYVSGVLLERRSSQLARLVWVTCLVGLWVVGATLTEGFLWVAFPLYFLVLAVVPGVWGLAAVVSMVGWSVVATVVRTRLDGVDRSDLPLGSWLGPLIGALAAILAYAVFVQLRRDAERHRALVAELRAAQTELAASERTAGMLAERERLAREIHDTIAQGLGSIVMLARTAPDRDAAATLSLIETTARDNLVEARRFVRDLASGGPSLQDALRTLARDTTARSAAAGQPLEVSARTEGPERSLAQPIVDALHRGAQASLANVVQHAAARRCVLTLTWWPDRVGLDVADDGVGFDPSADRSPESFGLSGLRARLAPLGGTVDVDSAPGEGTTVSMIVPTTGGNP